jgi:inner membrane protein
MTWRTHILGGTASLWILAAVPHGLDTIGLSVGAAMLGALVPDLDAPKSKLQSLTMGGIRPVAPLGWIVSALFPHRGPLHSLLGLYVFSMLISVPLVAVVGWQASVALSLGYASHLALDACTVRGVPVSWPSRRRYWLLPEALRIATSDEWEGVYAALLGVLTLILLIAQLA